MHERAAARRAVQGRRKEGGLLDQWQWPSAWGRRAERGGRGLPLLIVHEVYMILLQIRLPRLLLPHML